MWFRGQKIVCVMQDAEWHKLDGGASVAKTVPVHNGIYTIRDIVGQATATDGGQIYIFLLKEIVNPPIETTGGWIEPNFLSVDFRPLVERKTDISVFEKLLLPNERTGVKAVPARTADEPLPAA